jgi:tryptophan synthase beta chain
MCSEFFIPASPGQFPDTDGYFGAFGGKFVPEALVAAVDEVASEYERAKADPAFALALEQLLVHYAGRPSALTEVTRFAGQAGRARVFLKREDLNHTGSHKINNVLGQALLTSRMGKPRVIAETGAGSHGVAVATACALFGLDCVVYMGEVDMARQAVNVARMEMLGAEVVPVTSGSRTLKDAINETFRDWVANLETTHYIFGTVAGPHPFPAMIRDFQRVIGVEAERAGRLPDAAVACVGGGSNAIGLFHAFLADPQVRLIGCEAAGRGVATGEHAASLSAGEPGILHGSRSYVLQDDEGQITETRSISAGLDYPGVGPEHAYLHEAGRGEYRPVTDAAAMRAFRLLASTEGIIPAIESAHALAGALELGAELGPDGLILVNLSGRGDKDMDTAARFFAQDAGAGAARAGAAHASAAGAGAARADAAGAGAGAAHAGATGAALAIGAAR